MKIGSEERNFINSNKTVLLKILEDRTQDYMNQVVDEKEPQRKEVLSLLVIELRMWKQLVENISSQKEPVKNTKEYTGV